MSTVPRGHPRADAGPAMAADPRSDLQLWTALVGGDPDAFDLLYDRHVGAVHRFLARRVGSHDAEDLTAVVFTEAWRTRDRVEVDPERGIGPWLVGIAANCARAHLRSRVAAHEVAVRLAGTLADEPDHADTVVHALDDLCDVRRARVALESLSDSDQEVIALCVLEGMSPAEVAPVLGQRASTVRSRLTRARRRLGVAFDRTELPLTGGGTR